MSDKQLNGFRVAILATNGFEEAEFSSRARRWMTPAHEQR